MFHKASNRKFLTGLSANALIMGNDNVNHNDIEFLLWQSLAVIVLVSAAD